MPTKLTRLQAAQRLASLEAKVLRLEQRDEYYSEQISRLLKVGADHLSVTRSLSDRVSMLGGK